MPEDTQMESERDELVGLVRGLHTKVSEYARFHREHKDHGANKACNLIRQVIEKTCIKYLSFGEK